MREKSPLVPISYCLFLFSSQFHLHHFICFSRCLHTSICVHKNLSIEVSITVLLPYQSPSYFILIQLAANGSVGWVPVIQVGDLELWAPGFDLSQLWLLRTFGK